MESKVITVQNHEQLPKIKPPPEVVVAEWLPLFFVQE